MTRIATFEVTVHATTDKKKLTTGIKNYDYGVINLRTPELTEYIGKKVKIIIEKLPDV